MKQNKTATKPKISKLAKCRDKVLDFILVEHGQAELPFLVEIDKLLDVTGTSFIKFVKELPELNTILSNKGYNLDYHPNLDADNVVIDCTCHGSIVLKGTVNITNPPPHALIGHTYVVQPVTGKVHPDWNFTGPVTSKSTVVREANGWGAVSPIPD